VLVEGVSVEAPLEGTLLVIKNDDKPGVIGEVGTILGQHGINIATFALGRQDSTAVGVVNLDATSASQISHEALDEIRRRPAIQSVRVVKL
jgi:D-3-phosphoglycerate dehydrogenase